LKRKNVKEIKALRNENAHIRQRLKESQTIPFCLKPRYNKKARETSSHHIYHFCQKYKKLKVVKKLKHNVMPLPKNLLTW